MVKESFFDAEFPSEEIEEFDFSKKLYTLQFAVRWLRKAKETDKVGEFGTSQS